MSRGNNYRHQGDVAKLHQRIEHWRRVRSKRSPMPDDLWDGATRLAQQYGVAMIARRLTVGYASLKDRVELATRRSDGTPSQGNGFVELSAAQLIEQGSKAAVVELISDDGMRLTVRLDNGGQLDVVGLVQSFRAQRP